MVRRRGKAVGDPGVFGHEKSREDTRIRPGFFVRYGDFLWLINLPKIDGFETANHYALLNARY